MIRRRTDNEIRFLAGRRAHFRFECSACGQCCGEYEIMLSPYDIIRLRKATGCSTQELIHRGTVRISRMSFRDAFGFGPVTSMFDLFGLAKNDTVPIAFMGFTDEDSGRQVCQFLSPQKGNERLCGIYKHRPAMCRLHPLGCVTIAGRRRWFFRTPLCDQGRSGEQTVEAWIAESRMSPYLQANARYLKWMRELLKEGKHFSAISDQQWQALERIFYNFDAVRSGARSINVDVIEKMFYRWLSRTRPKAHRGG